MKIFVAIIAILIVVSAEDGVDEDPYVSNDCVHGNDTSTTSLGENDQYYDYENDDEVTKKVNWTGNVKTLVDTAQLGPEIILNISRNIYQNTTKICNGSMEMPNRTFLPSPTAECDLTLMEDLRAAVLNPQSFNSEKFLTEFWSSIAGGRLLKEIEERGVSEDMIKAAMKETWFNKTSYRDTAFNRLFLGTNSLGSGVHIAYNSWYTFDVARQNISQCYFSRFGKNPPIVVAAGCVGLSFDSWFIYPSHPFVDLLLYTLCIWIKDPEKVRDRSQKCLVAFPGGEKLFKILHNIPTDSNGIAFVEDVFPSYCFTEGPFKDDCDQSVS